MTNGSGHSFELYSLNNLATPELVSELSPIDEMSPRATSFSWRVATFPNAPGLVESQLVSYSSSDEIVRLWPMSVENQQACGGHPSSLSAKIAKLIAEEEAQRLANPPDNSGPTSPRGSLKRANPNISSAQGLTGSEIITTSNSAASSMWSSLECRKSMDLVSSGISSSAAESPTPSSPQQPPSNVTSPGSEKEDRFVHCILSSPP